MNYISYHDIYISNRSHFGALWLKRNEDFFKLLKTVDCSTFTPLSKEAKFKQPQVLKVQLFLN